MKEGYFNQRGAAALISVVVMTAIIVVAVSGTALIGIGNLDAALGYFQGTHAVLAAESCNEEAMLRLQRSSSYTGGTLAVGNATCTIVVTGNPCPCVITTTAVDGSYTRRVQANVTLVSGNATITSWQEND